ncbi:DNA repair protein RecO [Chitinimonas lacunae]|uniref:DNA repair protein RecO n=1 Tax=Chitinimonas lacunae TaxID=1963018 RepID=A0ABV8MM04_9NEIS
MANAYATAKNRVEAAPAYLIHQRPYRETSLLLELFSRDHGRVAMVARGARRPGSALRGTLLGFQPLAVSWFGGGEVKTLHAAEWQGGVPQLVGLPLICGFYLNELLLRLLPREDSHPGLFTVYDATVRDLAALGCPLEPYQVASREAAPGEARATVREAEPVLRRFELALLRELGYGLALDRDSAGRLFDPSQPYRFCAGRGFVPEVEAEQAGITLSGSTVAAMATGDFSDPQAAQQAKSLIRRVLSDLLGEAPLYTRQLLRDLQSL